MFIRQARARTAAFLLTLSLALQGACASDEAPSQDQEASRTTLAQAEPPRDPSRLPAAADDEPLPPGLLEDERNTIDVFRRVSRSVAYVTSTEYQRNVFTLNVNEIPVGTGSAFVWDQQGHVVTNFHVVQRGSRFSVTLADGAKYDARVVGAEPNKDLAVLRIDAPKSSLFPIVPGDSDHLVVGQKVLAIGNPFGLDQTLTTGVISALGREIQSIMGTTIHDVIQTDASINPGNSGGPLLNSSGELIGVNTAIYSNVGQSAGIGFAVPVSTVLQIVPQIIQYGRVKRAGMGVTLLSDSQMRRWRIRGVGVREVTEGSAAEEAGLRSATMDRAGRIYLDIIVGIDDKRIESYNDLYEALEDRRPGERVRLRFLREGEEREVFLVLQEI